MFCDAGSHRIDDSPFTQGYVGFKLVGNLFRGRPVGAALHRAAPAMLVGVRDVVRLILASLVRTTFEDARRASPTFRSTSLDGPQ
ncbi:MAG: hypothetical protein ACE5I3_01110, partial [Phycisphaerae bacterium]